MACFGSPGWNPLQLIYGVTNLKNALTIYDDYKNDDSGRSRGGSQGAMDPRFWLDQVLVSTDDRQKWIPPPWLENKENCFCDSP